MRTGDDVPLWWQADKRRRRAWHRHERLNMAITNSNLASISFACVKTGPSNRDGWRMPVVCSPATIHIPWMDRNSFFENEKGEIRFSHEDILQRSTYAHTIHLSTGGMIELKTHRCRGIGPKRKHAFQHERAFHRHCRTLNPAEYATISACAIKGIPVHLDRASTASGCTARNQSHKHVRNAQAKAGSYAVSEWNRLSAKEQLQNAVGTCRPVPRDCHTRHMRCVDDLCRSLRCMV